MSINKSPKHSIFSQIRLLDGAMGTQLIDRGLKKDDTPEMWNLEYPDVIQSIHKSYADAGADAILTNTFGATPVKLHQRGFDDKINEIIVAAVNNARKSGKIIIGDIGPSGKMLAPMGRITEQQLFDNFRTQANLLISQGVDAILIETIFDLREAVEAVKAVRSISDEIPLIVTMTFDLKKKGFFTLVGDTPEKCISELELLGADAVGANCTLNSTDIVKLGWLMRELTKLPLLIQPNAGQPISTPDGIIYPENPIEYASNLKSLIDLGIDMVGGCCGTTPEHIKVVRSLIGGN